VLTKSNPNFNANKVQDSSFTRDFFKELPAEFKWLNVPKLLVITDVNEVVKTQLLRSILFIHTNQKYGKFKFMQNLNFKLQKFLFFINQLIIRNILPILKLNIFDREISYFRSLRYYWSKSGYHPCSSIGWISNEMLFKVHSSDVIWRQCHLNFSVDHSHLWRSTFLFWEYSIVKVSITHRLIKVIVQLIIKSVCSYFFPLFPRIIPWCISISSRKHVLFNGLFPIRNIFCFHRDKNGLFPLDWMSDTVTDKNKNKNKRFRYIISNIYLS
jgi:hypothetical protein